MSHRPKTHRSGFRLIELLAVLFVIGLAIVLILPVINGPVHIYSRQMECLNNMRNVAAAINIYELTQRRYPGYSNVLRTSDGHCLVDPKTRKKLGVGYIIPLLAYLDHPELDKAWHQPGNPDVEAWLRGGKSKGLNGELRILICPSDLPTKDGTCQLSYVVNRGMQDVAGSPPEGDNLGVPRDWPANGVFFDLFTGDPRVEDDGKAGDHRPRIPRVTMNADYIRQHDGLASTCLLSENVDAGLYTDDTEAQTGMVWNPHGTIDATQNPPSLKPPDDSMRINVGIGKSAEEKSPNIKFARPSSYHLKSVNMAFCDGKVRFVSDSMDYYVYCLLMSPDGADVRLPGSTKVLPGFDRDLKEAWYLDR